jgi:hypothetical protein
VAITVGGQPLGASDLQLIRRVDVSEAMYAQTQVTVIAASHVDNMIVNRGPLGLAELTEIQGLNPTMLSRVVGRLDSSVWSGSGAIRTITALPGSRSPPTGRGLAAHLGGANRGHLRMRGVPSRRAGGCPGRHAARAGKPLRGPACGAPERPVSRVTRSRKAATIVGELPPSRTLLLLRQCCKVAVHELDCDCGFADRGCNSLDRPMTGVTGYENPRLARLE